MRHGMAGRKEHVPTGESVGRKKGESQNSLPKGTSSGEPMVTTAMIAGSRVQVLRCPWKKTCRAVWALNSHTEANMVAHGKSK